MVAGRQRLRRRTIAHPLDPRETPRVDLGASRLYFTSPGALIVDHVFAEIVIILSNIVQGRLEPFECGVVRAPPTRR